jgi:NADPH:quinone reductase-like Zn-dependent oxidoreductase
MKAAWFERFGAAKDVLIVGERPDPVPGPDEVLIRLSTSGVNPSDVKKRAGSFLDMLDHGHCIPHSDGAGKIVAVGSQVAEERIGQRVWTYQAQFDRLHGTSAEYIAIDASRAIVLPEGISYEAGACLGIPAMTAHRCVFADGDIKGQNLLVAGGAGRVGYYAIQWASHSGATVIATASNDADEEACKAAGAHHVVNHRSASFTRDILAITGEDKVQRVIEVQFGANLPSVLDVIATGGVIAAYSSTQVVEPQLDFYRMMFLDITLRLVIVYAMPESAKTAATIAITEAMKEGWLMHRINATFALNEIADAHELIEAGTVRGCVLVNLD